MISRLPIFASTDPTMVTAPMGAPARTGASAMTASGRRYLEGEIRWQARLRRTRRSRGDLDLAKAKRGRIAHRYVEGSHPTPTGKYDEVELARLGKDGKALAKPGGGWWFPLAVSNDFPNAVRAYAQLKASEKPGIRAWIVRRAREMGLDYLLPKSWGTFTEKPGPRETESGAVGTAALGGQQ